MIFTKTILISSLIMTMILSFSVTQIANANSNEIEQYDVNEVKIAFEKADQYIQMNINHTISFNDNVALQTMNAHEIQIVSDFVQMQNEYIEKITKDPNEKPEFDKELESKFENLKTSVKESKDETVQLNFMQWVLPLAFAWNDVCGGSFDNPHPEYIKKTIYTTSSQNTAIFIVEYWEYHSVAPYASNPLEWFNSNSLDYAKEISAYNCNFGAFRDQIVLDNDGGWDFRKQIKEPNPEFLDYAQPVWWWIWYTSTWHADEIGTPTSW